MTTVQTLSLRTLSPQDETRFIETMRKNKEFHHPFIVAPQTKEEFQTYLEKYQKMNNRCFLALTPKEEIIGVFNVNDIVPGVFQSAYLGYFAAKQYAGQGLMSQALKQVLKAVFLELKLHRIEANIQPTNTSSIHLAQRNGFLKEGFSPRYLKINNIWCDHFRFALTYEDWFANLKTESNT